LEDGASFIFNACAAFLVFIISTCLSGYVFVLMVPWREHGKLRSPSFWILGESATCGVAGKALKWIQKQRNISAVDATVDSPIAFSSRSSIHVKLPVLTFHTRVAQQQPCRLGDGLFYFCETSA